MKKWEGELVERRGWEEVHDGLEVKLCKGPDGVETFILCRSADRQEKEKAMHERFSKRITDDLERLERRLKRAKRVANRAQVERQIGRTLERNSRAGKKFQVTV